jgi:hypothetical protein
MKVRVRCARTLMLTPQILLTVQSLDISMSITTTRCTINQKRAVLIYFAVKASSQAKNFELLFEEPNKLHTTTLELPIHVCVHHNERTFRHIFFPL